MSIPLTVASCVLFWAPATAQAVSEAEPWKSFDFEGDALGEAPDEIWVPGSLATTFAAEVVDEEPFAGERCARLHRHDPEGKARFGNLMRAFDAEPLRGKRVRFSFAARATRGARAQGWMRVDRPSGMGFFDNMGDRPIVGTSWSEHAIVGTVDGDAKTLLVGVMLLDGDEAFFDDLVIEVLGDREPLQPPRELTPRGLENLTAFTRLYGYVRYFHPSDEAAAADWDALAMHGVDRVEGAEDAQVLALELEQMFHPFAPTLRVFPTGAVVATAPELLERPDDASKVHVRQWEHLGMGGASPRSVYRSARAKELVRGERLPDDVTDPADVERLELGGGVSCLLPIALYEASGSTIPAAAPKPGLTDLSVAELGAHGEDRRTRLAGVVIAWNVFQQFYPYFDVVEVDWPAELRRALQGAALDATELDYLHTLQHMVAALQDGHGNVFHGTGSPPGMLPMAWDWVEGRLTVTHVPAGSGVDLQAGDVVIAIEDRPVEELRAEEEARISGATPQWRRWVSRRRLASGSLDEPCRLRVETAASGEPRTVEVARVRAGPEPEEPRPEPISELEAGIWYVDVSRIDDEQFEGALADLATASGIVWDFRGYPRGLRFNTFFPHLATDVMRSPQWHVPVLKRPDQRDMTFNRSGEWRIEPEAPHLDAQHSFLTDGRAISYAESCMGIVENYELGAIVGGPTAGTNGNINPFVLPGGYRVIWTGMKVLKHDGSQHHGIGIQPTLSVERTRAGVTEGRDEVLEQALEELRSRID